MTTLHNFTTGHPVLDRWLRGQFSAQELTNSPLQPGALRATCKTRIQAEVPAPAQKLSEHPPIATVESGRSVVENEASPGAHPLKYWEGHDGLHKRS